MPERLAVSDLAWLSGVWSGELDGDLVEVTWGVPIDGNMAGVFRWLQDGFVHLYEIMAIEEDETGPVLKVRHFGPGLEPWEAEKQQAPAWPLVEVAGRRAVFEAPERSFPRRIVYERLDDDTLLARVEGVKASGLAELAFTFRRA